MALMNFTDMLMETKRRAQLQGRPISQQEVSGIAKGYAESAADKVYQEKQIGLQERGLSESSRQFSEQLAQRKYETELERKAAEEAKETEKMEKMASGVAGIAGGVVGGIYGGPMGAAVGAGAGASVGGGMYQLDPLKGVAKGLFGGCIIISSCTSPNSHEVQIAREYRDKFMSEFSLIGYYLLCMVIVPTILKSNSFKMVVKRILVDRLVDFGECAMGYKPKRKLWTSYAVTKSFLALCRIMGKGANMILEAQNAK